MSNARSVREEVGHKLGPTNSTPAVEAWDTPVEKSWSVVLLGSINDHKQLRLVHKTSIHDQEQNLMCDYNTIFNPSKTQISDHEHSCLLCKTMNYNQMQVEEEAL